MSRRKTLPSLSSSRQMMMAWKVSGLSQSPAIMASRPASMRLAMAISPSRERSSTEPISRRYMRTGSSVRSAGSLAADLAGTGRCWTSTSSPFSLSGSSSGSSRVATSSSGSASLVSTTLTPISLNIDRMSSICSELASFEGSNELIWSMGDVAALLGAADQLLDGRVGKVEQRAVGRGLGTLLLQHLFLLRCHLGLACHESPQSTLSPRRIPGAYAAYMS